MKTKKKHHRRNRIIFGVLQYLCLFLPYVIIMIVNRETYFTQKNSISMGMGCIACCVVALIIAIKKIKLLKGLGGFIAVILITSLMKPIIEDLTIISIYGMCGYIVSLIFESLGNYEQKYLNAYIVKEVNEE